MIYTITLNPAVDCAMTVADYAEGRVNRAESEVLSAGGKGINMSVILNRLGTETMALGFCGGDTGQLLCRLLDKAQCPHSMTELEGKLTRINMKLYAQGTETEINGKGPDISEQELEAFIKMLENTVKGGDTLILAGSIPSSVSATVYSDIADRFADKNVRIIADTSGKPLENILAKKPFLVKPNNFELGEICRREISTREQALSGAQMLREMGAQNVLVSLAGEGAVLVCSDGRQYEIDAPKGEVKNSVGAGDSMLAGFLAGLELWEGDYEKALMLGTAAGSATAFSESLAEKEEILALFDKLRNKG